MTAPHSIVSIRHNRATSLGRLDLRANGALRDSLVLGVRETAPRRSRRRFLLPGSVAALQTVVLAGICPVYRMMPWRSRRASSDVPPRPFVCRCGARR